MRSLIWLIDEIIAIYIFLLIVQAVLSWLVTFGIVNTYNRVVYTLTISLNRLTEPVLRPIRRILPDLGGLDISPVVLILLLQFVRHLFAEYGASLFF